MSNPRTVFVEGEEDIVFGENRFTILPGATLNSRYKANKQTDGTENEDSEIKKERIVFPVTIVIENKKTERLLFNLQQEKYKNYLYIVANGFILRNLFISSLSRPFTKESLVLIDVEFTEYNEYSEILVTEPLTLPDGRKSKSLLSVKPLINEETEAVRRAMKELISKI